MKNYRIILLGIAIILFGIAWRVMLFGYVASEFQIGIAKALSIIGMAVTIVGLFTTEEN